MTDKERLQDAVDALVEIRDSCTCDDGGYGEGGYIDSSCSCQASWMADQAIRAICQHEQVKRIGCVECSYRALNRSGQFKGDGHRWCLTCHQTLDENCPPPFEEPRTPYRFTAVQGRIFRPQS